MKKSFCMLIVAMVTPLLSGCFDNGSTADPPPAFTATAGEGRVKLTWTASPGVDYWLFTATDPSLTAFNWTGLPNAHAYTSVASPFYMCGLFNGTPYYFAANGRINGGPGGPSSPTLSATPLIAGSAWSLNSSLSQNIYGVGYTSLTTCSNNATSAAGNFAAVGAGGAIFISNDGMQWNPPSFAPGFSSDLYAVTGHAANLNNPGNPALRWVAVGDGGASVYSTDGITWAVGSAYNASSPALRSLTQVAGTFFAVGDAAGSTGTILSSTDGITWTTHTSGTTNNLRGVIHGTIYVAVGDSGTILASTDGNTWTAKTPTPVTTNTLRQVTSVGSIYVAVGDNGTIVTSIDGGSTWTARALSSGTPNLVGVAAESLLVANAVVDPLLGFIPSAQFVAVDSSGYAYTSVNGITWSVAISTGTPRPSLNALVSSGFGYVAAGNAGATASAF